MKTSVAFFRPIIILFVVILALNTSDVKAQCGFSFGLLDPSNTLTFRANPGGMDTEKFTVTNTSTDPLTIYVGWTSSNPPFQFRVLDSGFRVSPGLSGTASIRFQPSSTTTGTVTGMLLVMNAATRCIDTVHLLGIVKQNLCLETEHALSYKDPVVIGASAEHTFHLINQSGADIWINDVSLDDSITSGLRITSQLPMIVAPHSSNQVLTYTFSPQSDFGGNYFSTTFARINVTGDSVGCSSVSVLLIGNVAKPGGGNGIDTNLRPLFPAEMRTLAITGTGQRQSTKFIFTNNLNVTVTVNRIYMANGTYFHISSTDPSPTPFTLNPDQSMTVTISDSSLSNVIHTDSLIIAASHNLLNSSVFRVQGVRMASSQVRNELPSDVSISIQPNPASSYISLTLAGVRSAEIQICDLLGKQMVLAKSNSFWKWNTTNLPDATYIVRISGESLSGEHFVVSKRIVISR